MKKIQIVISLATSTLLFTGCGGGSSGTDTQTTSIEVERGKVYDSVVTDATGKVATKTIGSNIYVFSGTPTYPITATGGWIDLDGDGAMTTNDMELDVNLTSYSTVVTPITTYLADANSATREQKLQELATTLGTTTENLLKVPSKGTKDTIIAANAIFKQMKTAPNTLPANLTLTDINTSLISIKNIYDTSYTGQIDMEALAKALEQSIVNTNEGGIFTKLTTGKIAELQGSTSGITISGAINTASGSSVARGVERGILDSDTKIVVLTNGGETQKTYDVASNGNFSIPTSEITGNDMIILAVNGTTKEVYGNLKLSTATDDKLDFVDKSKLANSLNFGTLDNTNLTTTQTIANSNAFSSADIETLQTVARADDALVLAQNKYRNPEIEHSEIYTSIKLGTFDSVNNSYSSLDGLNSDNLEQVVPSLYMIRGGEWDNVSASQIQLFPPSSITYNNNQTASSSVAMIASYKNENEDWGNGKILNHFKFYTPNSFPIGEWILKANNVEKGRFVFNGAYPMNNSGKFTIPLPKVKFNMTDNVITSIDMQWYLYNSQTNQYEEVSDSVLNTIMQPEDGSETPFISFWENDSDNEATSTTWNGNYKFVSHQNGYTPTTSGTIRFQIGQILYSLNINTN